MKANLTSKSESKAEKDAIELAAKAHDLILTSAGRLYNYASRKPVVDARTQLTVIRTIEIGSGVMKLKKIARVRK